MSETIFKACSRCKFSKSADEFNLKTNGKIQPFCRQCNAEYGHQWYEQHKEKRKRILRAQKRVRRETAREYVLQILRDSGCVDCGEKDPVVLDFDHVEKKTLDISVMIHRGHLVESLKKEISKCQIRCSNCHRRKTAKQFGYYRYTVED